ncbi:MAG: hypothetical protein AAFZ65_02055 [Planctomycetota bacterium]
MLHLTPSSTDRPGPTLRLFLVAVFALLTAACASTDTDTGTRARITLRQFTGSNDAYELRSETHTDRLEYYSSARTEANVKIMRDDLMDALLRGFDDAGYASFARPGAAPTSSLGGGQLRKVIEVERDGAVTHVAMGLESGPEEAAMVQDLVNGFFTAFNQVRSYQSLDSGGGSGFTGPSN